MKFGQLIDYNMRTIFLKIHTQNMVEKLFPDPFLKNQNCEFDCIVCQVEGYPNIWKLSCRLLPICSYKAFFLKKFEINLIFLIMPLFQHDPKVKTKI